MHPYHPLLPYQAPILTRREQLGLSDEQLQRKGEKPEKPTKGRGRGKGRGKGRGRGRGKKQSEIEEQKETKEDQEEKPKTKDSEKKKPKKEKEEGKKNTPVFKRPAAKAASKAKARAAKKKETVEDSETGQPIAKKQKADDAKPVEKPDGESKVPATWAGRWFPTCPHQKRKFLAMKQVFDEVVAPKVKAQSSLTNPWVKICHAAFKKHGLVDIEKTTSQEYVAIAEVEVSSFMQSEMVRSSLVNLKILEAFTSIAVESRIWK